MHDRAFEGPVEITKYGRTTAFLVSAPHFKAMWASFRQVVPVSALSNGDVNMILSSEVATDQSYNLDDIPDQEDEAAPTGPKR
ncbi:hypothetical protein GCM10007880_61160 [Mesorhizobium amorphae]|uniref:hypothetical protein n=1 Tax=Mesorhizobium amorphae TaxID=71433 RepID=UPI00235D8392|nr:hypothetical protein [Mesorhizobium amorphae]GLR45598.1 hypothetical protein GCM10007880_61160 [Mesorhizobium amorphae]